MKKIFIKISLVLAIMLLLINTGKGQLPLVYGDAVISHSEVNNSGGTEVVLRTIKTNKTIGAPLGLNWDNIPVGTKKPNWNSANWIKSKLGNLFGITLDNQPNPNIYASNTQIYNGANTNASKVWRLDGVSGAHTLVYDFGNKNRSLGNLKYLKLGSKENLYVSNFDNGNIERLNGISSGVAQWAIQPSFNPRFGVATDDPQFIPYGVGLRNIGGGNYRLYYSKTSTIVYNTCEVWSVDLDPNGDFLPATEKKEILPLLSTSQPIADIDFTSDGMRMLIGQQTWNGFAVLAAHGSNVFEFSIDKSLLTVPNPITNVHNWVFSNNVYPSGTYPTLQTNTVGGVCYSNNILQKDSLSFACDTTVWFTSDAIIFGSQLVYGVIGMKTRVNTKFDGVFIDEDDYLSNLDKYQLGDVEIYKKPLDCNPCTCLKWESNPTLNGNSIPGFPIYIDPRLAQAKLAAPITGNGEMIGPDIRRLIYPLQFVKGNVSGVLNASYLCNGNCGATYTWTLTNDATTVQVANGTSLPIDLSRYNAALQCGTYTLTIKAKCGTTNCESLTIPITIICEPPSCCKAIITTDLGYVRIDGVSNINAPNAYSRGEFNFNFNFSQPISELRMSVEEFRLIASSPNCLNCNNRPVTWGNLLSAAINGTTGYVALPLTGVSLPTGNAAADYREAVYNTGTPISPGAGRASLILSLPAITELSCCEVKVYICIKFTYKDLQCRECVQMICGEYKITPRPQGPVISDVKGEKINIDAKFFKVDH